MKQVLFLNLTTFSKTGGIERFNRCFLRALSVLDEKKLINSRAISAYDTDTNKQYFPAEKYKGYSGKKAAFVLNSILAARKADVIFLAHINMAVVGLVIKKIYPSKKVVLITHGIDVWRQLSGARARVLRSVDHILSVSSFTKSKLKELHSVADEKVTIFPNTIDPFFQLPADVKKVSTLSSRYGISRDDFVIYTLTRLSSTEMFKGYDKVIAALGELVNKYRNVKYVIAGKCDDAEKKRIDTLIAQDNLGDNVVLTGFVAEDELIDHYRMADLYIMPSKKEGFGIVFIEALVCGLPVVAGNADGSVDALMQGELGTLVNPDSVQDIKDALAYHIENNNRNNEQERLSVRQKTLDNFSFDKYTQRLQGIIANC